MYDTLLLHIRRFVPLSEEGEELILKGLKAKKLKKKEHLWQPGQICTAHAFVVKGCIRMYITDMDGDQQTQQFAIENWWITDYTSFNLQKPTSYSVQAVEETEVILLDHQVLENLCVQIPSLERYFRKITQKALGAAQQRIQYIYSMSKEERYRHFAGLFPEFVQRVPQYMLASYLGFTPEFLSKIRAKKV